MAIEIPVLGSFDLIVSGGGIAGVAAASAFEGRAYLAAQETWLGADFCDLPILPPAGSPPPKDLLLKKLFARAGDSPIAFPLAVKKTLEDELEAAGVAFELGAVPIATLVDGEGAFAGVVFSGKCGAYAVLGRFAIDASEGATLARLAGAKFEQSQVESAEASRLTIAPADAGGFDGAANEALGKVRVADGAGKPGEWTVFRHAVEVASPVFTPSGCAAVEKALRDATFSPRSVWHSPKARCCFGDFLAGNPFLWPGADAVDLAAFESSVKGVFVAGPSAALSRADATRMLDPEAAVQVGRRLAAIRVGGAPIDIESLRFFGSGTPCYMRREPAREIRRSGGKRLFFEAWPKAADFGHYDVVVVGGGTGGAPAAIAAARAGAKVLLVESQHDLGGEGTLGVITKYWYGNRQGFTAEVTAGMRELAGGDLPYADSQLPPGATWSAPLKAEWLRREIGKAGGEIWFGATVTGALCDGQNVCGVTLATRAGFGSVSATVVVDSTGSADVAFAAGCECTKIAVDSLAIQGSGLPNLPFPPCYHNTDYLFVDDNDIADVTRAMRLARRRYAGEFDLSPIPGTRERRQIVADVTVSPLDVLLDRQWGDAVCRSVSDFDSHGYTLHPVFHVVPPRRKFAYSADLPLRAMLPRGFSGIIVTGLGIGCDRDAMPIFRMQPDIQNHSYAAGAAAALAAANEGRVRRIPLAGLKRSLAGSGALEPRALAAFDSPPLPRHVLESAASGPLSELVEIAALMTDPDEARPLLRQRLVEEADAGALRRIAKLLAALGDDAGADVLASFVAASPWDEGWNYTGMGQGGASESEIDSCIQCLAIARAGSARGAVLEKARQLPANCAFSHVRAVAAYAAAFRDPELGAAIADVLRADGISGHDFQSVAAEDEMTPPSSTDTSARNKSLIELCLARALYLCGDAGDGLAAKILGKYASDVRGYFARYAVATLEG